MAYFVYLLECRDGTIYTGIALDVDKRFEEHASGKGSSYVRSRGAKRILYKEEVADRSTALKREAEIKKWSRKRKLGLMK